MKKKRIIIIGVVLGALLLIGGGLFCFLRIAKKKAESKGYYGPVSNVVINYETSSAFDEYILINDGELFGVADANGKIIIKPSLKNVGNLRVEGLRTKYLVLTQFNGDNSSTIVYNLKGEKVYEDEYFSYYREDPITKKEYFETSEYICDESFNKIFNINDVYIYNIIDNIVYYINNNYEDSNYVSTIYTYDLETKSKLDVTYNDIVSIENHIYFLGEKSIFVNTDTKEIKEYGKGYVDSDNEKIVVTDGKTTFNYDYYGNKYSDKELTITRYKNGLYKDGKDCEYGAKLYDKNGKVISDNCNYYDSTEYYVAEHDWSTNAFIRAYDKNGKVFLDPKNNGVLYASIWNDDNYIYYSETFENDKTTTVVYDKNIKKHTPCKDNEGIHSIENTNRKFLCDAADGSYIADLDGNMLSDKYDNIYCNSNGICEVSDGTKQGIFYNDGFIVDLSDKYDIDINDNIALVKQFTISNVIKFGKVKSPSKLLKEVKIEDEKITLKQSIEDIIKEYNLEFEKDEIYANKDFFTKYAYVVFKNGQEDYNKFVFDIFKVVVDNKSLLNESAFLKELSSLNFELVNQMERGAGTFSDGSNTISLWVPEDYPLKVSSVKDSAIYHELMHFVDYSMNTEKEYIYNCNSKYYTENDIKDKTSCTRVYLTGSDLLVEAGAEFFASSYFNNYHITAYKNGVAVYIILEYLFGEKEMQKAFFSSNTETELFKLLVLKGGLSFEEFNDFLTYGVNIVYENVYEGYKEDADIAYSKIVDLLIKLYENLNGASWKDSYEFRLYLSQMFGIEGYDSHDESAKNRIASSKNKVDLENYLISLNRYMNGDTIKIDIEKEIGLITDPDANPNHMVVDMIFRIVNNKPTVVIPYELIKWGSNGGGQPIEKGTYVVNYDFENKKVIDFKQVYKEEIKDN